MFRSCYQNLYDVKRKRIVMPSNVTLRLNRGERPHPLPLPVQSAIANALASNLRSLQQYPSYPPFYDKLSEHLAFHPSQIVVGAGIEEFIRTLMFLCCDPGQKAAVLWPTCAMYDIYAEAFGIDLIRIKPKPGEYFSMAQFIAAIPEDTKLVFVPNPGQPVETYFDNKRLKVLADYCEDIDAVLAIDEAHWGFGAETALHLVIYHPNVLVLRTFSKFFGAASIRVGYAVGASDVIQPLNAARPSGEIAGPSMVVASVLLDNYQVMVDDAAKTAQVRDWLRQTLCKFGFKAWGSVGFSILIEFPTVDLLTKMATKLRQDGVLVKYGFPAPVECCMLLSVGSMEMAKMFLSSLRSARVSCDA